VREYTPEHTAAITGLSTDLLYKTALLYGNARAAFIGWTMGVNHSTKGTETVNAINNLALITGNIGRSGASPFSITGQCNAMGTREAGFTSSLPGYRKFERAADREDLAALWRVPVDRIPTSRGLAYPDIIEAALGKQIRALWVIGTNPIVSFPNLGAPIRIRNGVSARSIERSIHPAKPAPTSRSSSIWQPGSAAVTSSFRRGRSPKMHSKNGSASQRAVSATTRA